MSNKGKKVCIELLDDISITLPKESLALGLFKALVSLTNIYVTAEKEYGKNDPEKIKEMFNAVVDKIYEMKPNRC